MSIWKQDKRRGLPVSESHSMKRADLSVKAKRQKSNTYNEKQKANHTDRETVESTFTVDIAQAKVCPFRPLYAVKELPLEFPVSVWMEKAVRAEIDKRNAQQNLTYTLDHLAPSNVVSLGDGDQSTVRSQRVLSAPGNGTAKKWFGCGASG